MLKYAPVLCRFCLWGANECWKWTSGWVQIWWGAEENGSDFCVCARSCPKESGFVAIFSQRGPYYHWHPATAHRSLRRSGPGRWPRNCLGGQYRWLPLRWSIRISKFPRIIWISINRSRNESDQQPPFTWKARLLRSHVFGRRHNHVIFVLGTYYVIKKRTQRERKYWFIFVFSFDFFLNVFTKKIYFIRLISWVILTACQLVYGYFMTRVWGITIIVHFY